MKKLILTFSILSFALIGLAQIDTTIFLEKFQETKTFEKIDTISPWKTTSIAIDLSLDSTYTGYTDWIETHEFEKSPTVIKKRFIRHRFNDQGEKQKQFKIVTYKTITKQRRRIRINIH
jgi:hypothetical protein